MSQTQTFNVTCSGCSRSFAINAELLEKRRVCTFCGASLVLPPEAETAIKIVSSTRVLARPSRRSADCPVCARTIWVDAAVPGTRAKCTYCGTALMLRSDLSAAPSPDADALPGLTESYVGGIACPSCNLKKLRESDELGYRARCTKCGTELDLKTIVLERLMPAFSNSGAGIMDLVGLAIARRWEHGDVGLAEAAALHDLALPLNEWTPGDTLSPFAPDLTAEIVQFAVLGVSSATHERQDDMVTVVVPLDGKQTSPEGDMLFQGAVGLGMGASGHVAFGLARGNQSAEIMGYPSLLFEFSPAAPGSSMDVRERNPDGSATELGRGAKSKMQQTISGAFLDGARRFIALKAIFGIWLEGAAIQALTTKSIDKRFNTLGGILAKNAEVWSAGLLPSSVKI